MIRTLGVLAGLATVTNAGAQPAAGTESLTARLEQLAGEYAAGGTAAGSARSGELGEGQEKRIGLQLDGGKCYVFIAVGEAALSDLDLALESGGERLGEDTQPDNFPVVRACSPVSVRVEIVLTATRGAGAYVLGYYAVPADGGAAAAAQDELVTQLGQLATEQAAGAALEGDVFRGRLVEEEVAALSRALVGGRCYTLLAVGGAGLVELQVSASAGAQRLGDDVLAGPTAAVPEFCPATDAPVTVRVTARRGGGEFAFAVYGRAATGALTPIQMVDTQALTRRLAERAAQAATGMDPLQSPTFGSLGEGRSANLSFAVEAGRCYRVVAVAEAGITNLDLTLLVDGAQVGEDVEPDAVPVVGTCAAAAGTARLDVWAVAGTGGWAVGLYSGAQPASAAATPENPLFTLLDAAAVTLSAGATRASTPFTGALAVSGTQQYDVSLQSGKCYAFVGISDAGNLDLELTSGTQVLGRDTDLDTTPGVVFCAQSQLTVRAKLTLLSASGNFAFGVYNAPSVQLPTSAPRPTATGIAVGGTETDYVATQVRALHQQRAAALLPVSQVNRGTLQQAEESEFVVNLPAGRCYTIIAAGVPSVRDMDVTLTSPYGQVLATDATDDASPVLVTNPCPQWSGDYRIKVTMQYGYGAFGFQVFSQ
jgi:hypothetical protein